MSDLDQINLTDRSVPISLTTLGIANLGVTAYAPGMAKPKVDAAGGFPALFYVWKKAREAGGPWKLYKRLRSRNACKTCALGMGGARGGMVNEAGHFPEVCKKSVQAQAGDMGEALSDSRVRRTSIAQLQRMTPRDLEKMGRIAFPMVARKGDSHFTRASWDDALGALERAFGEGSPDETFLYSSGRSSNEAAFLFQLVGRAYGTPHIHNCSYYCHSASGVALSQVYGSGTASIVLDDIGKADFVLIAGANPASNHPRLITQLMELKRRGGKVVIVNPLEELGLVRFRVPSDVRSLLFGSQISDVYLKPHIGGDIALFSGLLKALIEASRNGNAVSLDVEFIRNHTEGWDAVERTVDSLDWDEIERRSGVTRTEIEETAQLIAKARNGIFCWAMGLTHHAHGVDNILALANLALARGWLGRPGAGLLPIRGHSNVQGVGSVGVSPGMKKAFAARLRELYGIEGAEGGTDTYGSMNAAEAGKMRAALLLGGNLFGSNPDRAWSARALSQVPFKCFISTKLNEGHVHGMGDETWILPPLTRDEEPQATSQESMFNYVRLSEGGEPAVEGEMRSEVDIIASFAERVLPPGRFDWNELRSHDALRAAIAKTVPGYAALAQLKDAKSEFQIEGRTFHEPKFGTENGKAHFHSVSLPSMDSRTQDGRIRTDSDTFGSRPEAKRQPHDPSSGPDLRVMTIRSEGQFNSVVYDEEDLYRGNEHRNVIMISAEDAERFGVGEGDPVEVWNETGSMKVQIAIVSIRAGNAAMYYPEANILVPQVVDPSSGTPAFKSVGVWVRR